jgi:AraC-like DNA-binding protein
MDVTEHAKHGAPTVSGFAVKRALAILRSRNIDVEPLLRRARLTEQALEASSQRILAAAQSRFLELAAEAMVDSAFGLKLADQTNPRDAGILFYVASGAKDLDEALSLFARYFKIVNEAVRLKLSRAEQDLSVEVEFVGVPRHVAQQNAEFGIAVILKALREIAGKHVRPARVAFVHSRQTSLRLFERFFLCPVEFAASADLMAFPAEVLAAPLITSDAKLVEALRPFCDMAAEARNTAKGSLRSAVENEVQKRLPRGKAQASLVAKSLALSERTLSRRLANEGATYAQVVDELRRSLALQYLKDPGLTLSQIAWLLGYEGSTSFNHAFRRWTGSSPSEARSAITLK